MAAGPIRRKSNRWSRDSTGAAAAAIFCGSVVANTNTTRGGGSSSTLSSAFHASRVSMWASSTM
jgi:formiminotetrahydrofolate cyclodeaminase